MVIVIIKIVKTGSNPSPKYDFAKDFYKFPSYLRRAAINEAIGKVSSYKSNYANWEENPKRQNPGEPKSGKEYTLQCTERTVLLERERIQRN